MALLSALRRFGALLSVLAALPSPADGAASAAAAAASSSAKRAQSKAEFARAMHRATRAEDRAKVRSEARGRMHRRILAKAVPAPPPSSSDGSPDFLRIDPDDPGFAPRAAAEPAPPGVGGGAPHPPPLPPKRRLDDAEEEEEDEGREEWASFGFDPADYSIKYTACSAIAMYSDEMAENEDAPSVFATKRFIVFRLCPSDYCGGGCNSSYGEYLIPLEDYLESMGQFIEDTFEAYCEYCEQCMYFEKYFYGHRKLDDGDDEDDDDDDDDEEEEEEEHACKYYSECVDYLKTCDYDAWREDMGYDDDQYDNEEEDEVEYREFFECQQVDDQYGYYSYYVGPHCSEDNTKIIFGIFEDAYCTQYIGNKVDVSEFMGIDMSEDVLAEYTPDECLSCKESDLPYMIVMKDEEDENDISELCENLYTESAKCNKNLYEAEDGSYMSYNQEANEGTVCTFIDNVLNGAYDQDGYIEIDQDEFDITKISIGELTEASLTQILGIAIFTVGVLAMTVWSCFLHRALQQQSKLVLIPPEQEFCRQESGVMIGRSMSRDFPENPENDHVLT